MVNGRIFLCYSIVWWLHPSCWEISLYSLWASEKGFSKLTSPQSPHSSHGTGAVEDNLWYLAALHSCALNIDAYYMALSVMRRKWQNALKYLLLARKLIYSLLKGLDFINLHHQTIIFEYPTQYLPTWPHFIENVAVEYWYTLCTYTAF